MSAIDMRTLVVVPTYEEATNITELLQRTRAAAPDVDVLVVDDNSPDGTAKLAQALGDELGHVEVLVRQEKSGLGTAYRAGFAIGPRMLKAVGTPSSRRGGPAWRRAGWK